MSHCKTKLVTPQNQNQIQNNLKIQKSFKEGMQLINEVMNVIKDPQDRELFRVREIKKLALTNYYEYIYTEKEVPQPHDILETGLSKLK